MKTKAYFLASLVAIATILIAINLERFVRWLVGKLPL